LAVVVALVAVASLAVESRLSWVALGLAVGGAGSKVLDRFVWESSARAAEVARAEGLPFPVIPDPERSISRRFGVGSWPTLVWIGTTMTVEAVDFGLTAVAGGRPTGHRPPAGK
jgi:hypothetical protein